MNHNFRLAAAVAALGLAGLTGLLTPVVAAAAPAPHDDLANNSPSKAQTERAERDAASRGGAGERRDPIDIPSPTGGDAAAWQLALSAALGAAVTGGVVLASRQVSHHRHAVAS